MHPVLLLFFFLKLRSQPEFTRTDTRFPSTTLFRSINLRESTVLGLVGAGGIGVILQSAIDTLDWLTVATILLAIIGLVIAGEAIAAWLRKRDRKSTRLNSSH